jgi:hypothetical protein
MALGILRDIRVASGAVVAREDVGNPIINVYMRKKSFMNIEIQAG